MNSFTTKRQLLVVIHICRIFRQEFEISIKAIETQIKQKSTSWRPVPAVNVRQSTDWFQVTSEIIS